MKNIDIEYKDGTKKSINSLNLLREFMSQSCMRVDVPEADLIKELKLTAKNFGIKLSDKEFMDEYNKVKKNMAPLIRVMKFFKDKFK